MKKDLLVLLWRKDRALRSLIKPILIMKNPTLPILLLLCFVCTSVHAQIDSLLTFPYKKEVQDIARIDGQQVSLVRFTEGDKKTSYCRMELSDYGNPSNSGAVLLNKENLEALLAILNDFSVKAGSVRANVYTEIVDGIKGDGVYLKVTLVGSKAQEWKLLFDRSPYLSITPIRFRIDKLPELATAFKSCLSTM